MPFNFQNFIINLLSVLLLIILLGLVFVITDRLLLDGHYTSHYNKTQRIRSLVGELNQERLAIFNLNRENESLKNSLNDSVSALKQERDHLRDTLHKIPSYQLEKALQKAMPSSPSTAVKKGYVAFNKNILFPENSFILPAEAKPFLNQVAGHLAALEKTIPKVAWTLQVGGHANPQRSPGEAGYGSNWKLAYKRAFGVVQYLISQGVNPYRLSIASFSQYQPDSTLQGDDRVTLRFE